MKDSTNKLIQTRSNEVEDSYLGSGEKEDGIFHKDYVEFIVRELRLIFKNNNIKTIFIGFQQEANKVYYLGKNVCVISN